MTRHLDDHDLAAATAGMPLDPEQQSHLEGCVSCRRTIDLFLEKVDQRRQEIAGEAPCWDVQLETILGKLPPETLVSTVRQRRWLRPLLAAAATLTISIGTGLIVHKSGPIPQSTPRPDIGVEEILAKADSLLAEDGILDLDVLDNVTDDDWATLFGTENS